MKLYIDFDGVILNTIEVSYKKIRDLYGDKPTMEQSSIFYRSINWNDFLDECSPINNSIENLKKIMASNLYDVTILTHVLSEHEQEEKEKYLNKQLPGIKVITVTKPAPKWNAVDCKGAILVDDYSENLYEWEEHGGIAIKFSEKDKKYDFMTIKSLDSLLTEYKTIKNRLKTRKKLPQ